MDFLHVPSSEILFMYEENKFYTIKNFAERKFQIRSLNKRTKKNPEKTEKTCR